MDEFLKKPICMVCNKAKFPLTLFNKKFVCGDCYVKITEDAKEIIRG